MRSELHALLHPHLSCHFQLHGTTCVLQTVFMTLLAGVRPRSRTPSESAQTRFRRVGRAFSLA
jgi:hypothetical protein